MSPGEQNTYSIIPFTGKRAYHVKQNWLETYPEIDPGIYS